VQKLLWLPIGSTLVGIGLIAASTLQGETRPAPAPLLLGAGERSYEISDFGRISTAGPFHVEVEVGPAASVRAEGPKDTLDRLDIRVEHGSLQIRPKHRQFWDFDWSGIEPATFHVTLPQLSSVSLAGSGDMKIDRVDGRHFSASVADSGNLDIASLSVDDANFSVAGSGDVTAQGHAGKAHVSIVGSGNLHLRKLASDDASISVVGSGDAAMTVRDNAHISMMGGGDVDIAGPAHCSVSRIGGGDVRCGHIEQRNDRS
jgi:hypothetical protein